MKSLLSSSKYINSKSNIIDIGYSFYDEIKFYGHNDFVSENILCFQYIDDIKFIDF